jgi:hypothetical protein
MENLQSHGQTRSPTTRGRAIVTCSPMVDAGESSRMVPRCKSTIRCTNRQPEPGARCLRPRRSIEATADVRALLGRDAGTCIPDRHAHVGVGNLHVHVDLRARGAVPDGVVDDVSEENREKPASPETNTCCSCVSSRSIPFASAAGRHIADRALQYARELDRGRLEGHGIWSQASPASTSARPCA